MGLVSVLINFLLQNTNLVSVFGKICPSFAGHVWQDRHISRTLMDIDITDTYGFRGYSIFNKLWELFFETIVVILLKCCHVFGNMLTKDVFSVNISSEFTTLTIKSRESLVAKIFKLNHINNSFPQYLLTISIYKICYSSWEMCSCVASSSPRLSGIELIYVVIGTDCTGSYKSN